MLRNKTTKIVGIWTAAVVFYFASSLNVSANDTASQVNREKKRDRLPTRQEMANSIRDMKRKIPKANANAVRQVKKTTRRIINPDVLIDKPATINLVKDTPAHTGLADFYNALNDTISGKRKKPVTILHLGADHIARDNFTGDLRELFQDRFGNAGRGMTMPGPVFPFYRARGMRITSAGEWTIRNSLTGKESHFGITGVTYSSRDPNASVQFTKTNNPFSWAEVSFFTGPDQGRAIVWVQGPDGSQQRIVDTNARQYGMTRIRIPSAGDTIRIFPEGGKPITIMSWQSGRDVPGIRYVNLGLPRSNVNLLQNLDAEFVQQDIASLSPSLIILSFGSNEGFDPITNPVSFEEKFKQLALVFKKLAPKASIMIIGPPDASYLPEYAKSSGSGGAKACSSLDKDEIRNYRKLINTKSPRLARWHPPLKLDPVRRAMRRAAADTGVFYWDWSSVMGGACGIHSWVHSSPRLANLDHRTLTSSGAKQSARALFSLFMSGFESYRKLARR